MSDIKELTKPFIVIRTVILVILTVAGMIALWNLKSVLFVIFFSLIISASLRPIVNKMTEFGLNRSLSVILLFVLLFGFFGLIIVFIVSQALFQAEVLLDQLPVVINSIENQIQSFYDLLGLSGNIANFEINFNELQLALQSSTGNIIDIIGSTFSAALELLTIIVLSGYIVNRKNSLLTDFLNYFNKSNKKKYKLLVAEIEEKLGNWLRGQLFLMLIIGIMTWFVVTIPSLFIEGYTLHHYALPISLMASLLEAVPNLGPFITWLITLVIAIPFSPFGVLIYISIAFVALQQIESSFISPIVMKKSVNLDPVLTITGVLSGLILFGFIGAVIIIPIIAVAQIIIDFYMKNNDLKIA